MKPAGGGYSLCQVFVPTFREEPLGTKQHCDPRTSRASRQTSTVASGSSDASASARGAGFCRDGHASPPDPSAALSCRPCVPSSPRTGLHISAGLLWLGTMMAQVFVEGFRPDIMRRLVCFNLFWHALDIIWVALFTIVYLIGLGR